MAKLISAAFSMRNIVLVLLAYFCFATAGSFAETVTLHPPLQEGAKISLEMNATRELQVEGQPAKKGSSSVIINVEVIEVEADHVVIGWTTGQGKLHSENPDPGDQVVETISSISAQQSLELVFDRDSILWRSGTLKM